MNKKSNQDQSRLEPPQYASNASPPANEAERQRPLRAMLSSRQAEIAQLVAQGLSDKEIGNALNLTEGTVGWHLNQMFLRCHVHSRTALTARFFVEHSAYPPTLRSKDTPNERQG